MKKLLSLLLAISLLISLFTLASCNKSEGEPDGDTAPISQADDGKPVVVLVDATDQKGTGLLADALEALAKKYQEEGRGEVVVNRVDASAASDAECDIVLIDTASSSAISPTALIAGKKLADLTPYLSANPDYKPEAFNQAVLEAGQVGNYRFLLPVNYLIGVLAGDKVVSEKLGLPGKDDLANYETFWEKMESWDKAVSPFSADISQAQKGALKPSPTFVFGGGELVDIVNEEIKPDAAVTRPMGVYGQYYSGEDVGGINPPQNYPMSEVLSADGSGLLYYDVGGASYYLLDLVTNFRANDNYFYGPVPYTAENQGKYSACVTDAFGVSADSCRQERACNFLVYCMNSDELYTALSVYDYTFPVKNDLLKSQCTAAMVGLELMLGANAAQKSGFDETSLYEELSNIGYSYVGDYAVWQALKTAMTQKGLDGETITANFKTAWKDAGAAYIGIYGR